MNAQILVVEDDAVVLKALEFALQAEGYQVIGARDSTAAMEVLRRQAPGLMILDVSLIMDSGFSGIADGFSFLGWARYTLGNQNFPVIIHTADKSRSVDQNAIKHGVFAVVRKGSTYNELIGTVRSALEGSSNLPGNPPPLSK
jgi:DNA-binding response OmpR family regulator